MKKRYTVLLLVSSLVIASTFLFYNYKKERPRSITTPKVIVKEILKEQPKAECSPSQKAPEIDKGKNVAAKKPAAFLQAPIEAAAIPFRSEIIPAAIGKTIVSSKSTQIIVPPNAFLDEKGNVVQGNVDLQFREFHDHTDIFLSGIPMTYENGQLESAGMIELTASLDNKPVFANPNSKIKIEMPSSNEDPDFNLYYLDTQEKKWKLKEEKLATNKIFQPVANKEIAKSELNQLIITDQSSPTKRWEEELETTIASLRNEKVTINGKKVKLVEPKMISGNYFDLGLNLSDYPELSIYQGVYWQTIDPKKQRIVAKAFPEKMKMPGKPVIRILNRIGESDSFKIRISGSASSVDIIFLPVFEVTEYCLAKNIYNRLLLSTAGENTEQVLEELNREKAKILVQRSFQIDGFGIWNCDRIYLIPNARTITAKLIRDDNNKPIETTFYLANKKVNSVFTYYSNRPNNLTYNPQSENTIWTVLENGRIAVYKFQDIENYSKGKTETIKMKVVEQEINSQQDVKKILNSI